MQSSVYSVSLSLKVRQLSDNCHSLLASSQSRLCGCQKADEPPGLGYGLLFDLSFFLRNLSVIGGLLMVLSDSLQNKKKLFAGLPSLSETDRRK